MLFRKASLPFIVGTMAAVATAVTGCQDEPAPAATPAVSRGEAATRPGGSEPPRGGSSASPPATQAGNGKPAEVVIKLAEPKDGKSQIGAIVVGGPEPAENVTYVYAKPQKPGDKPRRPEPMPSVSGNLSAMPNEVVEYVRFVRSVEEGRQNAVADRQERLTGKSDSDPAALAEARRAVKESKERLARLRARPEPSACRRLRRTYERALLLDGTQAAQDAALLTQVVSAARAGDGAAAAAFARQAGDPAHINERVQARGLAFGAADAALVELMAFYPSSPADFASIRFGDQPF